MQALKLGTSTSNQFPLLVAFNLGYLPGGDKAITTAMRAHQLSSLWDILVEVLDSDSRSSLSSSANYPKLQAEKLIRGLNLFPKDDVNIKNYSVPASKLVEKHPKFPFLAGFDPSVQEFGHHAGYYRLPHTKAARMFYLFFQSRSSKGDVVVIWLTGGPGCGSEVAAFYENGPFQITKNLSLIWNDYGWDKASNLLFVDQRTGTDFSYSSDKSDLHHGEEGVSNDLYDFL